MTGFPISRDPPEGGTGNHVNAGLCSLNCCFQFLGIPPKGEREYYEALKFIKDWFPISRDPPEGGTLKMMYNSTDYYQWFPISRDPPEGGT